MLRIHLFSIFSIKTPQDLAVLLPLGLLIVKTLTNVLYYILHGNIDQTLVHSLHSLLNCETGGLD